MNDTELRNATRRALFAQHMGDAETVIFDELGIQAWEASILPLYDARSIPKLSNEPIARKLALRDLLVAEAADQMVVHQSGRLHQRVDNRRPHEPEAALL